MRCSIVLWVALSLLLTSCARPRIEMTDGYQIQALQHWYELENWRFVGRLGVVSEQESFTASVDWRHRVGRDVIEMAGPWGVGRMRFVIGANEVLVDDGEQTRLYHQGVESIMAQYFGVELPVDAFQFWLLGLVEPGKDYKAIDRGFEQHGWRVIYRLMQAVEGGVLPHKVNMEKEHTKVKLIVDQWTLS